MKKKTTKKDPKNEEDVLLNEKEASEKALKELLEKRKKGKKIDFEEDLLEDGEYDEFSEDGDIF